ncbi:MAG: YebC/PmpR family DNA-binding transcriptional regulator [Patescibacteria group bacterium]
MSGHSKWSTIKHKKGALDAKRGALFTKIVKIIEVAARGGPDPTMNFKLKLAIQKAKSSNVQLATIDKAIKKGSGQDKEASRLEEIIYEGLAPGNVGVIVETLTDNKNRTVSDVRNIFTKAGGNFGTSVAWQFDSRGVLYVTKPASGADELELAIIDSGASDFADSGDTIEVYTDPKLLDKVKNQLESAGYKVEDSEIGLVPKNKTIISDPALAKRVLNLLDNLEDHDDVSAVYSSLDVPDEVLAKLE